MFTTNFAKTMTVATVISFGVLTACERTKKIDLDQQAVTIQLQKAQEQQPQLAAQQSPAQEPASGATAPH